MNTLGAWQESFAWRLQLLYGYSVPAFVFKFGRDRTSPLTERSQRRRTAQLAASMRRAQQDLSRSGRSSRCDIIAHSFGTLLLSRLLMDDVYQDLQFGRVILTGSIAPRSVPWSCLIAKGRLESVMNHRAGRDIWVRLAPWVFPNTSQSGLVGFTDSAVVDRLSADFEHSAYFIDSNYDRVIREQWNPFLTSHMTSTPDRITPSSPSHRDGWASTHRFWVIRGAAFATIGCILILTGFVPALFRFAGRWSWVLWLRLW